MHNKLLAATLVFGLLSFGNAVDPMRAFDYPLARFLDASLYSCKLFPPASMGSTCYLTFRPLSIGDAFAQFDEAFADAGFSKTSEWTMGVRGSARTDWKVEVQRGAELYRIEFGFHRTEDWHSVKVTLLASEHPTALVHARLNEELDKTVGANPRECGSVLSLFTNADPTRCYNLLKADSVDAMLEGISTSLALSGYELVGNWSMFAEEPTFEMYDIVAELNNTPYLVVWANLLGPGDGASGSLQIFDLPD